MQVEDLKIALVWITQILKSRQIPYQITGGLAARAYGAERPINDIDIEIPDNRIDDILPEIRQYIIEGPLHFNDGVWELNLITLRYKGQFIDLSVSES